MIFSPTCVWDISRVAKWGKKKVRYVDDANERPCLLFYRFIVLLVVSDTTVVIVNRLVWVPPTILEIFVRTL
jgi:hypothetical protein